MSRPGVTLEVKTCSRCGLAKNASEFFRQRAGRGGLHQWCKTCTAEYHREWRARPENLEKRRAKNHQWDLKKDFGITPEQYQQILERQNGVCAVCKTICPSGRRLAVDHDHETNTIRGLLCTNCNRGLGCFKDNPDLMAAAIDYLRG